MGAPLKTEQSLNSFEVTVTDHLPSSSSLALYCIPLSFSDFDQAIVGQRFQNASELVAGKSPFRDAVRKDSHCKLGWFFRASIPRAVTGTMSFVNVGNSARTVTSV